MSVWKSDEKLLSICILNFSFKNDFVWEEISNIRHSVSSPDETLRLMFDILLIQLITGLIIPVRLRNTSGVFASYVFQSWNFFYNKLELTCLKCPQLIYKFRIGKFTYRKVESFLEAQQTANKKSFKRGVNSGMQIRRSVVFFGPIRRSDLIFVQIRIRVTEKIFRGI